MPYSGNPTLTCIFSRALLSIAVVLGADVHVLAAVIVATVLAVVMAAVVVAAVVVAVVLVVVVLTVVYSLLCSVT